MRVNGDLTFFIFFQLHRRHTGGLGRSSDSIEELRNAFEMAERSSPGITDIFLAEIIRKLQPNVSDNPLKQSMERLRK